MKKTIALLLCLLLLFGTVSCAKPLPVRGTSTIGQGASTTDRNEPTAPPPTTAPSDPKKPPYEEIIAQYTALLEAKSQGNPLPSLGSRPSKIEIALHEIVRDAKDVSLLGYATKDLNRDGIDELVLLHRNDRLYALFTVKDDAPVLLLRTDHASATVTPDGTVYAGESTPQSSLTQIKQIVNGSLEGLSLESTLTDGGSIRYSKTENGVSTDITKEEYLALSKVADDILLFSSNTTKTTGFRFVSPLADNTQGSAPTPDFLTYEGILSAYRIIVESLSDYPSTPWVGGAFDRLFHITDNDTYDVFHHIFWSCLRLRPTETYFGQTYATDGDNAYGYAVKDLNGDGIDELILLTDKYRVIAVFTQRDGRAVLLKDSFNTWIDGNGRLRASVSKGGVVRRDSECFVYEIDGGQLTPAVAVGYRVNVYLEKEGWYRIDRNVRTEISAAEGERLYAEYDILPEYYSTAEYTRAFSGIGFTPLFDATLAGEKHLKTFSVGWALYRDAVTVSEFSDTDVTASLRFVWMDGEYDPETNPDPVNEIIPLNVRASRDGNRYTFEQDGIKGYLEFAVNAVWTVITESQNEHVPTRVYLFDTPEIKI